MHELELVAYCEEHDVVLCGACVFEHITHRCLLLDDPRLDVVVKEKKEVLQRTAEEMARLRWEWAKHSNYLDTLVKSINEYVQIHKSGIAHMEEKMTQIMRNGAAMCIAQLENLEGLNFSIMIVQFYKELILQLNRDIMMIQEKYENFHSLTMHEKLLRIESSREDGKVVDNIPEETGKIIDKICVVVDYKNAITQQRIF